MGIWNSHTSVGNILGALVAGAFVESNWGLSFIVPGVIAASVGLLAFLFLMPRKQVALITSLLSFLRIIFICEVEASFALVHLFSYLKVAASVAMLRTVISKLRHFEQQL